MSRLDVLNSLTADAWFSKLIKKLKPKDLEFCMSFLSNTENLPVEDFLDKVKYLYLDRPKPKNHTIIVEILERTIKPLV